MTSPLSGLRAMIFAAGLGTRFKPWTDHHPKALAIVNGKSLLQRNIEYLQQYGIREVVVNVHHFADQIVDAIEKNNGWGSKVFISDESDEVLETGGGLMKARQLLESDKPFLSINVDILTNLNLHELYAYHTRHRPLISFAVTQRTTSRYFLFDAHNRLCGWMNQQTGERKVVLPGENLVPKAYSCVVVYEPQVFSLIHRQGKFSLTQVYLDLAPWHTILGYDHTGDCWVDVGKPESVVVAEQWFK